MYSISFRIYMATVAGQKIYVNGCGIYPVRLVKGDKIVVREKDQTLPDDAEVIESARTNRTAESYVWTIL